jgi:hypothetical protein
MSIIVIFKMEIRSLSVSHQDPYQYQGKTNPTPTPRYLEPSMTPNPETISRQEKEIQTHLDTLNAEIRSKQRLAIGLQSSVQAVDDKVQDEIYNRDRFIDVLN